MRSHFEQCLNRLHFWPFSNFGESFGGSGYKISPDMTIRDLVKVAKILKSGQLLGEFIPGEGYPGRGYIVLDGSPGRVSSFNIF